MRFLWPDMLWLLLAAPLLVAGYIFILRRRKRSAIRYSSLLLGARGGAWPTLPPARAASAFLLADGRGDRGDGAADRVGHVALSVHDRRAGDGCLAQHAGNRCRAHPHQCRAGRRQVVHRGAAAQRSPRHRLVRRYRQRRADADRQQAGHAGCDRPVSAAARDRHRQRADPRAGDAVSGRRHRHRNGDRESGARRGAIPAARRRSIAHARPRRRR